MLGLMTKRDRDSEHQDDAAEEGAEQATRPRRQKKNLQFGRLTSLLSFGQKSRAKEHKSGDEPPHGQTMMSTQHNAWIRKCVGYGVIAAIVCGPVALYQQMNEQPEQARPVVESGADAAELAEHDRAGAFGTMVVSKWVTATRDGSEALDQYFVESATQGFDMKAMEIANPFVVSATKQKSGIWSVVVSVDTKATEKVKGKDDKVTWTTRHFEIPVRLDDAGGAVAERAPSMVPLPAPATGMPFAYEEEISASGAINTMSDEFLNALLAGSGDVSRLTTPGSEIAAIEPAAFESVTVSKVTATQPEVDDPTAGDTNELLVTATGKTAAGEVVPLQYSMSILSRDGRWEVKDLTQDPAVEKQADEAPASPTESPAGSPEPTAPTPTD